MIAVPRLRARRCGITTALGSRANRMMMKPMAAFQKPTTNHGVVSANRTSSSESTTPKPPARQRQAASDEEQRDRERDERHERRRRRDNTRDGHSETTARCGRSMTSLEIP